MPTSQASNESFGQLNESTDVEGQKGWLLKQIERFQPVTRKGLIRELFPNKEDLDPSVGTDSITPGESMVFVGATGINEAAQLKQSFSRLVTQLQDDGLVVVVDVIKDEETGYPNEVVCTKEYAVKHCLAPLKRKRSIKDNFKDLQLAHSSLLSENEDLWDLSRELYREKEALQAELNRLRVLYPEHDQPAAHQPPLALG